MLYLIKLNIGNKQYRKCIPQLTLGRKTTTKNLRSFNTILQLNDKRFSFSDGLFFYIFFKNAVEKHTKKHSALHVRLLQEVQYFYSYVSQSIFRK